MKKTDSFYCAKFQLGFPNVTNNSELFRQHDDKFGKNKKRRTRTFQQIYILIKGIISIEV